MKAILIWSDGYSLNYTIFDDKDDKTGFERAQEQMFKEYDERNASGAKADIELGACKATTFCNYVADGADSCIWQIIEFPDDNPLPTAVTSYSDACETIGAMVDVVEDFLEEKGITKEDIPNDEREDDPDAAIIYGSDYDELADKFANIIGISRNAEDYEN